MSLLLSFVPPFSSCFSHIRSSLTVSASKISVQDLQMPSPPCGFFWFFLCRPGGKQALPSWQFDSTFSVLLLLHFYFPICIGSYLCARTSSLDSETPHRSDELLYCGYQSSGYILEPGWIGIVFRLVLLWFGWFGFLFACYSISAHWPNDVGQVS